ncbi:MAG: response regulator transcription factor [Flavobacterium sp.]|nr:response regulator transcription factor [Flavobacterium sp.]
MKFNALVVDDEHSGRVSLKILLNKAFFYLFDKIETVATLTEAIAAAETGNFNICFLDVELGDKKGFDLLPHLSNETKVIFVTAYSEYAIKALREKAFDYLLKPINPVELNNAVKRYEKEMVLTNSTKYLLIKDHGYTIPIDRNEIHYIEAKGPYSKVFLINNLQYTTAKTLKTLTEQVGIDFIRIHKSYAIHKSMIKSFKKDSIITISDICLPVSRIGSKVLAQYF